jgi:hypothetical protein
VTNPPEPQRDAATGGAQAPAARWVWTLFAVLALASVLPVFLTSIAPLNDYPNHLARMHVLANLENSQTLQQFYRNVMDWQPNLAMEAVVPVLARFMPLELAGKVFIAATLVLTAAGTLALHFSIHRRWSLWPLLAFFFLYHRMFLWGLLNFAFGIGLMLCALALWIALRDRAPLLRIAVSTVCAVLVYLSHLYAFGIYAIAVGGIELWYLFRNRPLLRHFPDMAFAGVQFLLPLYLFAFHGRVRGVLNETHWGSLWRKLEAPFSVIYQYNLVFDIATLALLTGLALWGLLRRKAHFAMPLLPALVALCIVFLAMPDALLSGYGADKRLPIAIALIGVAALDWPAIGRWWREPAVIGLMLLFAVRMGLVMEVWHRADAVYADYIKGIDMLPRGAKLLFYALHPEEQSLQEIPYLEIADFAVIRRDALMPSLFTSPPLGAQAIAFSPEVEAFALDAPYHIQLVQDLRRLGNASVVAAQGLFRPNIVGNFDYVLVIHPEALPPESAIPPDLDLIYRGRDFVLLKVNP